ncbi:hypothetical protein GobsT_51110 [Gemmata obscuriglobus]|uniref:Uncharacterized protein n=1 Tax=Gemmata obscuriglobus TaxID=114 RepID=A0A2Z3H7K9_9BACT|nr:hypothetical protein [Gemmata obscuriglobus]AWM37000.1 hypothetical protein C1280_08185 [Gemmata obscuriglobus]QEG30306.1 hypothetical protein GobsT_51110 [Gemmata obscuriglobus]VTS09630.1 Helicase, C-terminal OS=Blastopirellula marina DSM 3645 GN=DSM3645_28052 PE=4 SV=1 [Gemmata obscuriglobus UQM 2246]
MHSTDITPQDTALANALDRIPETVSYTRRFPLGKYRGLAFGIERHPVGGADVYLEGQASRTGLLSSHGPRAVLNALGRLADSYGELIDRAKQDRELAQRQLADYEARIGRVFQHTAYMEELTGLRDRLKTSLSGTPAEGEPTAGELAEQIKALKAGHQVEAAPARVREKPKAERRRSERVVMAEEAKPVEEPKPEETKPADDKPDDGPGAQGAVPAFAVRVKRLQQRSLF